MDPKGSLGRTDLLWSLLILQSYFINFLIWDDALDVKFVIYPPFAYWLSFHRKSPARTSSKFRDGRNAKESKADLCKLQMKLYLQKCSQKSYKREGNEFFKGTVLGTGLADFD